MSFDNALKITVQIPDTKGGQELKNQINALAAQSGGTGLEYLNQLAANPNVKWDEVTLANEKWSYSQAGLTPAGAALLSIAVAAYAPGLSTGITSAVGGGSIAAGLNAGFIALQSQAAVALVNNGGDIGKTLEQLGSEQSIKNLLTVMVTAGALSNLNQTLGFNGQSGAGASGTNGITTSQAANQFTSNLLKNVTNNVAGAAIDSAINGKPLDEKALASALSSALVTAGMAQGANTIGASDLNSFTNKLAHAALGCAGGAAMGGSCESGAVGAVVGELAAEYINPTADPALREQTLAFAKTIAAVAGVIVGGGGNNAADVNIAATAGANAAENNYLSPKNNLKRNIAQDACAKDPGSPACNTAAKLNAIDQRTDEALAKLAAACTPGNLAACQDLIRTVTQLSSAGKAELQAMMNELQPSCAPPRDCTQAVNWANNELKGLDRLAGAVWRTNASGQLEQTVGPEGVVAGGTLAALRLSALGFTAGSSFDAAGQLWQNGTVRWEQSLVAGITAGVGTPLAARGKLWIPGTTAGASAANTIFNNVYYGEETDIGAAAVLGGIFGTLAPSAGRLASNLATPWLTQTPRISISGATPTFPIQSRWPNAPGGVKTGVETTVGNIPSFIPLDNGKQESK
ncbi:VENN motif-containing domain containing protein [Comamonadaceae bacterium]